MEQPLLAVVNSIKYSDLGFSLILDLHPVFPILLTCLLFKS